MCEQNAYHPKDPFPSSHCTHQNQLTFRVGQQGGRSRESPGGITNTSRSRSWCYEGRCRCNERGEHDDLHVGIFRFVSAVGGGADVCLSFHLLDPQLQWEEEDWGVSDSAVIHYHTVNVVALDDRDEGPMALKECISTCNCYFRQVVVVEALVWHRMLFNDTSYNASNHNFNQEQSVGDAYDYSEC